MLAERILSVERSPFYSITDLAAKRGNCIFLHLGEPDFVTPPHILEAAKKAMDEGHTHYGPDRGSAELRQLIAERSRRNTAPNTTGKTKFSSPAEARPDCTCRSWPSSTPERK